MIVKLGPHEWAVEAVEMDKRRRKYWVSEEDKLDYIEWVVKLYFGYPAAAKHCFNHYDYNEGARLDIINEDRYAGEWHLENYMKVKQQEGKMVVLEKEKVMGDVAPKLLNDHSPK